jgi:hypothetical protein
LVAKRQDLDFQRSSRSKQPDQREPDQSAERDYRAEASPDSLLFASRIRFTIGTAKLPQIPAVILGVIVKTDIRRVFDWNR